MFPLFVSFVILYIVWLSWKMEVTPNSSDCIFQKVEPAELLSSGKHLELYVRYNTKKSDQEVFQTINRRPRLFLLINTVGRSGGLMVRVLDFRSSGPGSGSGSGSGPGCVVFMGTTLYSHVASLHPGV